MSVPNETNNNERQRDQIDNPNRLLVIGSDGQPSINFVLPGDSAGGFSSLGRLLASMVVLASEPQKQKRASQKALDSLKPVDISTIPESDRTCSICFDPFAEYHETNNEIEFIDDSEYSDSHRGNAANEEEENTAEFMSTDDPGVMFPTSPMATPFRVYNLSADPVYLREQGNKNEDNGLTHRAVKMPCNHIFGESCIREWLKNEVTCPLCRKEVESEEPSWSDANGTRRFSSLYTLPFTSIYIRADTSRVGDGHDWTDPDLALPEIAPTRSAFGPSIIPGFIRDFDEEGQNRGNGDTNGGAESNNNAGEGENNTDNSNGNADADHQGDNEMTDANMNSSGSFQSDSNRSANTGSNDSLNSNDGNSSGEAAEPGQPSSRIRTFFALPRLFSRSRFSSGERSEGRSETRDAGTTANRYGGPVRTPRQGNSWSHPYFASFNIIAQRGTSEEASRNEG